MFLGLTFLEVWFVVTSSLLLTYITTNGLEDLNELEKGDDANDSTKLT